MLTASQFIEDDTGFCPSCGCRTMCHMVQFNGRCINHKSRDCTQSRPRAGTVNYRSVLSLLGGTHRMLGGRPSHGSAEGVGNLLSFDRSRSHGSTVFRTFPWLRSQLFNGTIFFTVLYVGHVASVWLGEWWA